MNVIDFLKEYWQFIGIGLVIIFVIISIILKRKSIVEIFDNGLTAKILELVIMAESKFGSGHGFEKMEYVVSSFFSLYPNDLKNENVIRSIAESILSSPHKKEK